MNTFIWHEQVYMVCELVDYVFQGFAERILVCQHGTPWPMVDYADIGCQLQGRSDRKSIMRCCRWTQQLSLQMKMCSFYNVLDDRLGYHEMKNPDSHRVVQNHKELYLSCMSLMVCLGKHDYTAQIIHVISRLVLYPLGYFIGQIMQYISNITWRSVSFLSIKMNVDYWLYLY